MEAQKSLVVVVWKSAPESAEKKVLVLQVTEKRGAFWQPVTGKVDEGESFLEAGLREAEEETGFHYEHRPQYLGLEYLFTGRHGPAVERAFFLPIYGGTEPPAPKLDPKEHQAYRWVTPTEALAIVHFPTNREAIERATSGASPLLLARNGAFYQDGEEITHARTAELFHRSLQRNPSGGFVVRVGEEELDVVVEESPRFVTGYDRHDGRLRLSDGSFEILRPDSIEVRGPQGLRCTLSNGWTATFLPAAYYEIAKDIEEGSTAQEYFLNFRGSRYPLAVAP